MSPSERSPSRVRTAHLRIVGGAAARAENEHASAHTDVPSLDAAYRRFAPYVAAIAMRILGRSHELDDLVQDVFVEATRGIASLSEPQAIKAWLARIAVRAAVRRLRRRRLLRALHLTLDEPIDEAGLISAEATPEQRALLARVYTALDALSAADRVAWVLRHVQGESLEHAAELCDCSQSTFQRRLRRAAEHLEKELRDG